ncbi:acetyl/propionyl-CoA carboxylase subunit alpha [Gordonia pseudamarae]|uniref:biotin carboxylase n=1 Tax=Gordonia pseudamarae TaxID=2831662 RepID=A0ABX6IKL9_9ACTN|nr:MULTISPECIES: biotin carboxylase N-terminal domain-containing protein [Gordonia]MBD0021210.1 acetyl/propionyl-CoA carboxylase subunit alpha [Gordonia sp. (in: high G+C Gram-positive bacteria)]QHN27575.1 acetyl/propionyl-CoA carboxylase subunit alpha [Gordonia pseudamarae]QHN36457.1 acetyl/propionyl-CoA carboxylase subunit alpha [Gordonia pseudamarae]
MSATAIRTVLIANRGEIACRVITTLRRMGIRSVAVYSDADVNARHVAEADVAVRIGPAEAAQSYLDIGRIVGAARATGADAVHPGYGFLSENRGLAAALEVAGIIFIGPPAAAIATMGDKIAARAAVAERNVPVVPGISRPGLTDDDLIAAAPGIGFPVLIKPSAGGGGKGMHCVEDPVDLPAALRRARREAGTAFGDDSLFLEHFVDTPRHIEVQVLADNHGTVIHLGERECSLQRRHQKVIEEAPSALLDEATRARIGRAACDAARSVGYSGAGTVEFIVAGKRPDDFFFMEMNTRLQVEHPVTELVAGVDLVEQQIRVARGETLSLTQDDVVVRGHAVEARVYAEDPASGFLPTGGTIALLQEPEGPGLRVDSSMLPGLVVGSDYDPMLAKVIAHGADREQALERLDAALAHTRVLGVVTNIDFCRHVLNRPEIIDARLDTGLLDRLVVDYVRPQPVPEALVLVGLCRTGARECDVWRNAVGWRVGGPAPVITRIADGADAYTVSIVVEEATGTSLHGVATLTHDDGRDPWTAGIVYHEVAQGVSRLIVNGVSQSWSAVDIDGTWWVSGVPGTWRFTLARSVLADADPTHAGELVSPMPGTVVAVPAADGAPVAAGAPVIVVEAMKMEHTLTAPVDGVVTLSARAGDKVGAGQILATVTPSPVESPPSSVEVPPSSVEVPPSSVEVPPSSVEVRGAQATSLETS